MVPDVKSVEERDAIEAALRGHAVSLSHPLVVPKFMAAQLQRMGVDGPFLVSADISADQWGDPL